MCYREFAIQDILGCGSVMNDNYCEMLSLHHSMYVEGAWGERTLARSRTGGPDREGWS